MPNIQTTEYKEFYWELGEEFPYVKGFSQKGQQHVAQLVLIFKKWRSLVGRVALIPTLTQITNKIYGSISNIYWFYNACNLCRLVSGRGHPDLRLFVMPTLINRCVGKRTLRSSLC